MNIWVSRILLGGLLIHGLIVTTHAEATEDPPLQKLAHADSLWEVGLAGGGSYLPDYPASGQNHLKGIAAPYLIYRGNILRADREGTRARLIRHKYFDLELSFAAAFSSDSEDNDARREMPDLDYILEAGPRLSILLIDRGDRGRLRLFVPLRAAFSTSLENFKHRGYTCTPALYARWNDAFRPEWISIVQLTANFADRGMNGYFYDVTPEFATPTRPHYDARSGYLGTDAFAGIAIPVGRRWRLFSGAQLLIHEGSANTQSPLFKNSLNYSVLMGFTWTIYESKQLAKSRL